MVNERIVETFEHIFGKFFELVFRQIQCFHQLVEHHLMNVFTHYFVLAGFTYDVDTREVSHRRQYGVRAVEQGNFSLVIRSFGRNEKYVKAGFVGGKFFGYALGSFDYPQVENFGLYHQVVVILQFFFDSGNIFAGESRYDTVYERSIYAASLFEPFFEIFTEVPQFDILIDGFFQFMAIEENKFAGKDDKALGLIAIECFITVIKQLSQFTGIRRSGSIVQFTSGIESDTSFGRIGYDETHLGLLGKFHKLVVLSIRIERTADDIDHCKAVYHLTFVKALQIYVIKAILLIEHIDHTFFDRLYDNYATIEIGFLVHIINNPIYKCT